MNRTVLATLLLFLLPTSHAQTSGTGAPIARKADPVKVTYDKFEDRSRLQVEIRPAKVALPDGSSELARVPLNARFECPGQNTKCSPMQVLLSHNGGAGLAACDSMSVIFVADGERIQAGECRWLGGPLIVFQMPTAAFMAVSKASRVEAKIGLYVWSFDGDGLDAIRALAAHIELPTRPAELH